MATRSRPAQGNNSTAPLRRPRPAYAVDSNAVPKVVSVGRLSQPKPNRWGRPRTLAPDAAPKVINL